MARDVGTRSRAVGRTVIEKNDIHIKNKFGTKRKTSGPSVKLFF